MKMKKIVTSVSSGILATFVPLIATANQHFGQGGTGQNVFEKRDLPGANFNVSTITGVAKSVADWLFTALLILAVIMIIIAAFRYLFAAGNEDRIKKANQGLLFAAVAIAVGLLAQAIVFIVAQITGNPL